MRAALSLNDLDEKSKYLDGLSRPIHIFPAIPYELLMGPQDRRWRCSQDFWYMSAFGVSGTERSADHEERSADHEERSADHEERSADHEERRAYHEKRAREELRERGAGVPYSCVWYRNMKELHNSIRGRPLAVYSTWRYSVTMLIIPKFISTPLRATRVVELHIIILMLVRLHAGDEST